ncbi:MAG: hypothetical protein MJ227_01995 [Bacilli bacterium]|nr:hypothetical protein [Bacilli bacterium]
MNKKNFVIGLLFGIFALATNIFILVEAGTPGGASGMQSTGVSQAIGDAINTMVPSHPIDTSDPNYLSFMRKFIGHFSLFGVSGIFTILSLIFFLKDKFKSNWFVF